jgi:hypothetical protein
MLRRFSRAEASTVGLERARNHVDTSLEQRRMRGWEI